MKILAMIILLSTVVMGQIVKITYPDARRGFLDTGELTMIDYVSQGTVQATFYYSYADEPGGYKWVKIATVNTATAKPVRFVVPERSGYILFKVSIAGADLNMTKPILIRPADYYKDFLPKQRLK